MGQPGYIYTAEVLTWNGYEGVKIGMTTRTPIERYREHKASGDFHRFSPMNSWPVPNVRFVERLIKKTMRNASVATAPGFTEVFTPTVNPEIVAECLVHVANGRQDEYQRLEAKYNRLHPTEYQGSPWPNRQQTGNASEIAGSHVLENKSEQSFAWLTVVTATLGCIYALSVVSTAYSILTKHGTSILVGMAWIALAAIPIATCIFIWHYGMNLANDIEGDG